MWVNFKRSPRPIDEENLHFDTWKNCEKLQRWEERKSRQVVTSLLQSILFFSCTAVSFRRDLRSGLGVVRVAGPTSTSRGLFLSLTERPARRIPCQRWGSRAKSLEAGWLHCAVTSHETWGGPFQDGSLVVAMQDRFHATLTLPLPSSPSLSLPLSLSLSTLSSSLSLTNSFPLPSKRRDFSYPCYVVLFLPSRRTPVRFRLSFLYYSFDCLPACLVLYEAREEPRDPGNSNEGYFIQSTVDREPSLKSLFWMQQPSTSLSFSLSLSLSFTLKPLPYVSMHVYPDLSLAPSCSAFLSLFVFPSLLPSVPLFPEHIFSTFSLPIYLSFERMFGSRGQGLETKYIGTPPLCFFFCLLSFRDTKQERIFVDFRPSLKDVLYPMEEITNCCTEWEWG